MKKVLLDTSGYSKLFKGDVSVQTAIEEASITYLSTIVVGELLAGFKNGLHEIKNKRLLEKFTLKASVSVIPVTEETAEVYAQIYATLKKSGTPLPINDIWIAAHAVETGAKLITYDRHFSKIPGLRIWDLASLSLH